MKDSPICRGGYLQEMLAISLGMSPRGGIRPIYGFIVSTTCSLSARYTDNNNDDNFKHIMRTCCCG